MPDRPPSRASPAQTGQDWAGSAVVEGPAVQPVLVGDVRVAGRVAGEQ
ncbi:hypothetical protein [Actinoplanes nipponensis]